jgi:hypothetical protein
MRDNYFLRILSFLISRILVGYYRRVKDGYFRKDKKLILNQFNGFKFFRCWLGKEDKGNKKKLTDIGFNLKKLYQDIWI